MKDQGKRLTTDISKVAYTDDVLLGKYLTQVLSETFTVLNHPVRLIGFGFTKDTVQVLRVWRPASSGARDSCGDLLPSGEVLEMPYKVGCKEVFLDVETPEIVIDGVGEYRLLYKGDNRPDVHVVQIADKVVVVNDTSRGIQCACCGGTQ